MTDINIPDSPPTLTTERLILRPLTAADGKEVQRLAGDVAIASTTLSIPHPYEDGMAESWIATHPEAFAAGRAVSLGIVLRDGGQLIGITGLDISRPHLRAELGYWVGKDWWNRGYCTEAARAIVAYGLDVLELNKIVARHLVRNPASGRVIQKLGMAFEGINRQHILKWDKFEDIANYGLLRCDPR